MKTETFTFNGLHAVLWQPQTQPIAVLQVVHGMTEHMGRYEALAAELCSHGIALTGFDLRGHGRNPGDPNIASFGPGGWDASIRDIREFFLGVEHQFPGLPHYLLGFSLGSFLLREYLGRYPQGVAGAIIAGTGHEPGWLLGGLMSLVSGEIKKSGVDGTTDLIRQLSFGTYNQSFKPNRTQADWLCDDRQELDSYLADPLVRRDISAGLFRELLGSMKRTGTPEAYAAWVNEMPVLLLYGKDDPVGKGGKGIAALYGLLRKAGQVHLDCRALPNARHDIFHEESTGTAATTRRCIAHWIKGWS